MATSGLWREPIQGSYLQAVGKDKVNPLATIHTAAMILESLHPDMEAGMIRDAVDASLKVDIVTEDITEGKAAKTSQVGDWLAEWISKK